MIWCRKARGQKEILIGRRKKLAARSSTFFNLAPTTRWSCHNESAHSNWELQQWWTSAKWGSIPHRPAQLHSRHSSWPWTAKRGNLPAADAWNRRKILRVRSVGRGSYWSGCRVDFDSMSWINPSICSVSPTRSQTFEMFAPPHAVTTGIYLSLGSKLSQEGFLVVDGGGGFDDRRNSHGWPWRHPPELSTTCPLRHQCCQLHPGHWESGKMRPEPVRIGVNRFGSWLEGSWAAKDCRNWNTYFVMFFPFVLSCFFGFQFWLSFCLFFLSFFLWFKFWLSCFCRFFVIFVVVVLQLFVISRENSPISRKTLASLWGRLIACHAFRFRLHSGEVEGQIYRKPACFCWLKTGRFSCVECPFHQPSDEVLCNSLLPSFSLFMQHVKQDFLR